MTLDQVWPVLFIYMITVACLGLFAMGNIRALKKGVYLKDEWRILINILLLIFLFLLACAVLEETGVEQYLSLFISALISYTIIRLMRSEH